MSPDVDDRAVIRELIERWTIWKDTGQFDRFRTLWHDDGAMRFTWFAGGVDEFIEFSRASFDREGPNVLHALGGSVVDVVGDRSVAVSRVTASFRLTVEGVEVDIDTHARYVDFFERREGRWGMVFRQPVYERDRITPVRPGDAVEFDEELLMSLPEGCRYLAYAQVKAGFEVFRDVPVRTGEPLRRLESAQGAWLAGGALSWPK